MTEGLTEILESFSELSKYKEKNNDNISEFIDNLFLLLKLKIQEGLIKQEINEKNKVLLDKVNTLLKECETLKQESKYYWHYTEFIGVLNDLKTALEAKELGYINNSFTRPLKGVSVEKIEELSQEITSIKEKLLGSLVYYNNKYLENYRDKIFDSKYRNVNYSFIEDLLEKIEDKEYLEKLTGSVAFQDERKKRSERVSYDYEELQLVEYFDLHRDELIKFLPKYLEMEKERLVREKTANELLNLEKEYLNASKLKKVLLRSKLKAYGVTEFSKIGEVVESLLNKKDEDLDFKLKQFFVNSKKYSWGKELDLVIQECIKKGSDVDVAIAFESIPTADEVRTKFYNDAKESKQNFSEGEKADYYINSLMGNFGLDLNFLELQQDEVYGKEAIVILKILNVLGKILNLSSNNIVILAENLKGINLNLEDINNYSKTIVSNYLHIIEQEVHNVSTEKNRSL